MAERGEHPPQNDRQADRQAREGRHPNLDATAADKDPQWRRPQAAQPAAAQQMDTRSGGDSRGGDFRGGGVGGGDMWRRGPAAVPASGWSAPAPPDKTSTGVCASFGGASAVGERPRLKLAPKTQAPAAAVAEAAPAAP